MENFEKVDPVTALLIATLLGIVGYLAYIEHENGNDGPPAIPAPAPQPIEPEPAPCPGPGPCPRPPR